MVWRDTRQDRRREQPDRGPQCVSRHSRALLAGRRANAVGRVVSRRFGCGAGTLDHDSRITRTATPGFAALNIADTTAARGKIAAESMGLQTRLDRLRAERGTIAESRSVATIDAELQRAQPGAATVWRPTAGCRDVTLPNLVKPARPFWRSVKRSERRDGATRSKSIYAMPRHNSHGCRPSRPPIPRPKLPQTWSAGRHSAGQTLPLTTFAWLALPGWS